MEVNYTLMKMYNSFEIENCYFSMQCKKPQLIALLTAGTMFNCVEMQRIMTLMEKPFDMNGPRKMDTLSLINVTFSIQ